MVSLGLEHGVPSTFTGVCGDRCLWLMELWVRQFSSRDIVSAERDDERKSLTSEGSEFTEEVLALKVHWRFVA